MTIIGTWVKAADVRLPGLYLVGHTDGLVLRLIEVEACDGGVRPVRALMVGQPSPQGDPECYRFLGPLPLPSDDVASHAMVLVRGRRLHLRSPHG